jgi:2-polyprenyl-3-methyl-5-hydroxy-6-metoxy-1,4-benzoquinol methylase
MSTQSPAGASRPPLVCPACRAELRADGTCTRCGRAAVVRDGVVCFTDQSYASSFGAQWLEFSKTQLDSASGTQISEDRFRAVTGWSPAELRGKSVLDVGCGSGRFTEVAIGWGADVTALDLSAAVFAARAHAAGAERARFVQADALSMPFASRSFDFAFSIGVAQHTPDPLGFVHAVGQAVRPGGQAALWIYERSLRALLHPKYVLRPVTSRLPTRWTRTLAAALVDVFFPLAERVDRAPEPARAIALRALPIACHLGRLPLDRRAQREWSLLDTIDWYSPRFDSPQTFDAVARTLREAGARHVERMPVAGVAVRAHF